MHKGNEVYTRGESFSWLTQLHGHGDERWPTEVTSNTYSRGVILSSPPGQTLRDELRASAQEANSLPLILRQEHDRLARIGQKTDSLQQQVLWPRWRERQDGNQQLAITKKSGDLGPNQYRSGAWDRLGGQDSIKQASKQKCRGSTIAV